jgi:beta-lactamase class A
MRNIRLRQKELFSKLKKPTRRQLQIGLGVFAAVLILVQVVFPTNRMLPFAKVDGLAVGGWLKKDASWELAQKVAVDKIDVQRGNEKEVYASVSSAKLGVNANSGTDDIDYPWYARLVPTSLLWYGLLPQNPTYKYSYDDKKIAAFIKNDLADCQLAPQNASLKYANKKLEVTPSKNGGVCDKTDVQKAIKKLQPKAEGDSLTLSFPATITPPKIKDRDASKVKTDLEENKDPIVLVAAAKEQLLTRDQVFSWLTFNNSGESLTYTIDQAKSDAHFAKMIVPLVTVAPGVTKVTTRDFTEVARANGTPGQTLDSNATRASIVAVLAGTAERAQAATVQVAPRVEYTRSYSSSDVGLSALLQQFAQDNPGTFGIQYIELAGQKRRANYNESKQFITASTYKLYVAYSTLKRVESGQWSWSDQITGGQNLTTCFDKMIVNSDNACAEALYSKIGYQTVINEARALGLTNTSLDREAQKTSAGDLATFLGSVYSGTIDINADSRSRLVSAMKRNVYRKGVPTGSSGVVADKVGFLNALLHDASIVYSNKGDYVLVVMTDGSSWEKIAELTRKIESIR